MHVAPFQLLFQERSTDDTATAWFIPGGDPAHWVEMLLLMRSLEPMRLYVVPRTDQPSVADGLVCLPMAPSKSADRQLATGPKSATPNSTPANHSSLAGILKLRGLVALKSVGGDRADDLGRELWIPSHSRIIPKVAPSVLMKTLPQTEGTTYLWLAGRDVIGFEPGTQISLSQLVRFPIHGEAESDGRWRAPPEGVVVHERIRSIGFLNPPKVEDLFQEEREQIGGTPLNQDGFSWSEAVPGENSFANQWNEWFAKQLAKLTAKLDPKLSTGMASKMGGIPGVGALSNYVSERLHRMLSKSLEDRRHKQIEKLLRLMDKSPDLAIKYAIPLSNALGDMFRGFANPGWMLQANAMKFSSGGGARPVDPWTIRNDLMQKLRQSYRDQANREVALGRHRRAAYIYAHLLGELLTAASVLEAGKHYVEASILYGEKLKRPREQARCLMLAGQFHEAAKLFRSLGEYELEGDAFTKADDVEAAQLAYENAVSSAMVHDDPLRAAKIIETKLKDWDRAETLLWSQWPSGHAVLPSIENVFQRMGELGQHDRALTGLKGLAVQCKPQHMPLLAGLGVSLFESYPDAKVKAEAEDLARVAASRQMRDLTPLELDQRTATLAKLAKQDPLLSKDLMRYADHQAKSKRALIPVKPNPSARPIPRALSRKHTTDKTITEVAKVMLASAARYCAMHAIGSEIFVVSTIGTSIQLQRGFCDNHTRVRFVSRLIRDTLSKEEVEIRVAPYLSGNEVQLVLYGGENELVFKPVHLGHPEFSKTWIVRELEDVGKPRLCAFGSGGTRWAVSLENKILELRSVHAGAVASYDFTSVVEEAYRKEAEELAQDVSLDLSHLHLVVVGEQPLLICDRMVFSLHYKRPMVQCRLPSSVQHACPSPPMTQHRVALATADSVSMLTLLPGEFRVASLCSERTYYKVAWLPDGHLIGIAEDAIRVFQRLESSTRCVAEYAISKVPQWLLPLGFDSFALGYDDGELVFYRFGK